MGMGMGMDDARMGWVRGAGVALAVAWGVRALLGAQPASFVPDLVFYAAAVVVVCVVVLGLLGLVGRWMRPEDAGWLQRQTRRWALPGVAAAGLAVVLCLDQAGSAWLRTPELREVHVVRSACSRISGSQVKATIQSAAADGQWCFEPANPGARGGRFWRVDIARVQPARELGQPGRLQLRAYPSWIFGAGAYTVVHAVL